MCSLTERSWLPSGPVCYRHTCGHLFHLWSTLVCGSHSSYHQPCPQSYEDVRIQCSGGKASLPGYQVRVDENLCNFIELNHLENKQRKLSKCCHQDFIIPLQVHIAIALHCVHKCWVDIHISIVSSKSYQTLYSIT